MFMKIFLTSINKHYIAYFGNVYIYINQSRPHQILKSRRIAARQGGRTLVHSHLVWSLDIIIVYKDDFYIIGNFLGSDPHSMTSLPMTLIFAIDIIVITLVFVFKLDMFYTKIILCNNNSTK